MRLKISLLFRLINRFGWIKGTTIFFKNSISKKGVSSFRLPGSPHPLFLRRDTSDVNTFYHVYLDEDYHFKQLGFSPKFIVDCGANIGLASLYLKGKYPDAQIVAIEPEQSNYDTLVKNTKDYGDIDCIRTGVWNTNAILKVEDVYNMGNWGMVCRETDVEDETTIRAMSISEIMRRYNKSEIDILKIDIEGSELELFSSNYEDWLPRTKLVIIELHDWVRKGCSKSFFTALVKYDFSVYRGGENVVCLRN